MSFLARVAARASAPSLGAAERGAASSVAETVPLMTSKSPLVRFDQRLMLPGFAEMAPVSSGIGGRAPESDDGLSAPSAAETSTPRALGAPSEPSTAVSALRRSALAENAEATPHAHASFAADAALVPVPRPFSAAFAESAERHAELALRPRVEALDSQAASVAASPPPVAELAPAGGARARVETSASVPALAPQPARETVDAPVRAGTVFDAVARLDAWLRSDARDEEATPLGVTPPATAPQPFEASEAAVAPAISIGKLEIEVVPPALEARFRAASPAPAERQRRPAVRAPRPVPAGGARAFGWRQR